MANGGSSGGGGAASTVGVTITPTAQVANTATGESVTFNAQTGQIYQGGIAGTTLVTSSGSQSFAGPPTPQAQPNQIANAPVNPNTIANQPVNSTAHNTISNIQNNIPREATEIKNGYYVSKNNQLLGPTNTLTGGVDVGASSISDPFSISYQIFSGKIGLFDKVENVRTGGNVQVGPADILFVYLPLAKGAFSIAGNTPQTIEKIAFTQEPQKFIGTQSGVKVTSETPGFYKLNYQGQVMSENAVKPTTTFYSGQSIGQRAGANTEFAGFLDTKTYIFKEKPSVSSYGIDYYAVKGKPISATGIPTQSSMPNANSIVENRFSVYDFEKTAFVKEKNVPVYEANPSVSNVVYQNVPVNPELNAGEIGGRTVFIEKGQVKATGYKGQFQETSSITTPILKEVEVLPGQFEKFSGIQEVPSTGINEPFMPSDISANVQPIKIPGLFSKATPERQIVETNTFVSGKTGNIANPADYGVNAKTVGPETKFEGYVNSKVDMPYFNPEGYGTSPGKGGMIAGGGGAGAVSRELSGASQSAMTASLYASSSETSGLSAISGLAGIQIPAQSQIQMLSQSQISAQSQIQMPSQSQVQIPNQAQIQLPAQTQIQMPSQSQVQIPNQAQIQLPAQTQIQMPSQSQIQMPNQAQIQLPAQTQIPQQTQIQLPLDVPIVTPVTTPIPTQMNIPIPGFGGLPVLSDFGGSGSSKQYLPKGKTRSLLGSFSIGKIKIK